jgi:hypothetical protein
MHCIIKLYRISTSLHCQIPPVLYRGGDVESEMKLPAEAKPSVMKVINWPTLMSLHLRRNISRNVVSGIQYGNNE